MGGRVRWQQTPPKAPGVYCVRPNLIAFLFGPDVTVSSRPQARLVMISEGDKEFDAGEFRGVIADPYWDWIGPLSVPAGRDRARVVRRCKGHVL